jgi:mono/diheme cytochrome c family protein
MTTGKRKSSMQYSERQSRVYPLIFAATLALPATMAHAQTTGIFTGAQAQAGRGVYAQNCSGCHGADFGGSGDAPALTGSSFMSKWRPKMVSELFGEILQNMPPTNPGSLGEAAALNVTAYILQSNGAQPGPQALNPGATSLLSAIATVRRRPQARRRRDGADAGAGPD